LGVNTPRSDEDRLKLMELMVFMLQKGVCDEIGITAASLSSYCYQKNNQVGDLSTHTTRFISPALTQKDFANMKRVGKGFLGVETPLFEGMLAVRQSAEEGVAEAQVQVADVVAAAVEENVAEDDAEFPTQLQQVINVYSALSKCVENLENANATQKLEIVKMKARVKKLEKANKIKSSKLRRLKKVGASRRVESSDDMEDVFNQERMIADMDMDEGIELVKDAEAEIYNLDLDHSLKVLSMQEDDSEVQEVVEVVTTAKLITEVVTAAALQVSAASTTIPAASVTILATKPTIPVAVLTVGAAYTRRRKGVIIRDPEEELSLKTPAETPKVKDKGKGILVETPKPLKKKDQIEMDAEYAKKLHAEINKDYEEFSKDIDWDATMDHAKQKSNNPEKRLEVVEDEDDDVFVEATLLTSKVPIVDYHIVLIDNKPRFKIIRADETHKFYISFATLLKNFDREDLENLWRIVKDRFSTSKPTNFSDEYLLLTLKTMFEEPNGQYAIWRNQKSVHGLALVKR
nr:hypothetical protein [Tanacetum cinerariifolium]